MARSVRSVLDSDPDVFPFPGLWSLALIRSQVWGPSLVFVEAPLIPFLCPVPPGRPGPARRVQDRLPGCWVRMWLWRRVAEENLFPQSEHRNTEAVAPGGDEGDEVSAAAAAFSAT